MDLWFSAAMRSFVSLSVAGAMLEPDYIWLPG